MAAGLLDILPDMVLSMMAGHLNAAMSTQYIAALSLSSLFQVFITDGIVNGFSSAMDTLCSQSFGGNRTKELWMFTQASFVLYFMCLPFMAAMLLSGKSILLALGQDTEIAAIAGKMLIAASVAIPFDMVYATMKGALQAQNIAWPFMLASLLAWIVSGVSAYLLAYHTSLGIVGIAMASPISWCVKMLVLAPVLLKNQVFQDSWPGWRLTEALALTPKVSKLGFSSVFMVVSQMVGYGSISLLAGLLPNASIMISANGIFVSLLALSVVPLMSFCIATAIRIGNSLGAGQARRATLLSRVVLMSSFGISILAMVIMGLVAKPYASSFTSNEEATSEAATLIHMLMPVVPLLGLMLGLQGIFRACGKQMLCAQFNFLFLFVFGVPFGLILALKFDAGVLGLWVAHGVGLALFLVAGFVWLSRLSWHQMAHAAKMNTSLHIK